MSMIQGAGLAPPLLVSGGVSVLAADMGTGVLAAMSGAALGGGRTGASRCLDSRRAVLAAPVGGTLGEPLLFAAGEGTTASGGADWVDVAMAVERPVGGAVLAVDRMRGVDGCTEAASGELFFPRIPSAMATPTAAAISGSESPSVRHDIC